MSSLRSNPQISPVQTDTPPLCGGKRLKGIIAENSAQYPLVTVITAVFNARPHIQNCLENLLLQDYPNIEHIVLDGGSSDGTLDVLREYDDRIAFWNSERDKGVYDAWNKGLAEARGEWICFLGADDEFVPGAIRKYMELAAENPGAEYLSAQILWMHSSGYGRIMGKRWTWSGFRRWMCVAHPGSMHRRSLYERLGQYDTSYRSAADYEFLLRARDELKTAYMPMVTVVMNAGGVSDGPASLEEAYRAKITAGGCNTLLAGFALRLAKLKFALRPLRRVLVKIRAR